MTENGQEEPPSKLGVEAEAQTETETETGTETEGTTMRIPRGTWFGSPEDTAMEPEEQSSSMMPPLAMVIRKTSILGCLTILLGGLLWCIMQTVGSIQQWKPPSGEYQDPFCWPVVKSYLFLGLQLGLFVTVTLFACMIPTLVMTWITGLVMKYLLNVPNGRRGRRRLIESAGEWAKEMSWSTLKSAMREGKVFAGAAVITLCLLPWVLGTSNIFAGKPCL